MDSPQFCFMKPLFYIAVQTISPSFHSHNPLQNFFPRYVTVFGRVGCLPFATIIHHTEVIPRAMPFLNDLKYGLEENSTSGPDLKKLLAP